MAVNERLAQVRKDAKLTQVAFANKLNVSRAAYLSYELGERAIPTSLTLALQKEFGIAPTWLLTGAGARTAELYKGLISDAVIEVRRFAIMKKLKIEPEREAELVVLLVDYFSAGGEVDTPFVRNMLEVGT